MVSARRELRDRAAQQHGFAEPERQHRVRLPGGGRVRFDLAYPDRRLFVELDGWAVHGTRAAFEHDRHRQNGAVRAGWRPLRFTWLDVEERPAFVAAEVAACLG